MMRKLRAELVILAATAMTMAISGCGTPPATPRGKASLADADQQPTPFLGRGQYSDRVGLAIDDSLKNHRFTLPWIAVRGPDGSAWFVAERFQSEHQFDRIYVRVMPEDKVTASITPYQFHASDWATLGKMFVGDACRLEAESITGEITQKLKDNRK
jgi:hypothetical protein